MKHTTFNSRARLPSQLPGESVPEELETAQIPPHIMAAMRERMKMAQAMGRIKHKIVVMSGKGGVGKCLRRGTGVITGYGDWQPIEVLGTPVVSLDEDGQASVKQKRGRTRRRARINILRLKSGIELGLTRNHLLYTYGRWKPLRDLKTGDRIATIRWLPEPVGPDELTEEEATVLGLLLGDGGLTGGVPGFTNAEATIVGVLRSAVRRIDPILRVSPWGRNPFGYIVTGGRRGGKPNAVMVLMRRLGVDVPSTQKFLPSQAFRSSNRILAAALRGLFSTDGSVYDDKIEYSTSSPLLARDVHRALLRFGIHSVLRDRASHYVKNGIRHPALRSYRLLIFGKDIVAFAKHVGFWGKKRGSLRGAVTKVANRRRNPNLDTLPREVWEDVEAECRRKGLSWARLSNEYGYKRVWSIYGGHAYLKQGYLDRRVCPSRDTVSRIASLLGSAKLKALAQSNIYWDRIVDIEESGRVEVFDIEVEGSHNFVAEGVLVHNSTVAANLAVQLAEEGRVGLVDADVTGPDIPKLMGLEDAHVKATETGLEATVGPAGVKVISMAQLIDRDTAVVWRGPLKIKALKQMLSDVEWGELDYLVIDLPPGTSDEPLSVAQEIPDADGAVVVTTPQEVSLLDVRKSIAFARAVKMEILGVIENMSGLVCPHCGESIDVFKVGGGEAAAKELGLPFLGRIPLDPRIVVGGDAGKPFVLEHPDSEAAKAFRAIVANLKAQLKTPQPRPAGPLAK